jgi:hypothetical protein
MKPESSRRTTGEYNGKYAIALYWFRDTTPEILPNPQRKRAYAAQAFTLHSIHVYAYI